MAGIQMYRNKKIVLLALTALLFVFYLATAGLFVKSDRRLISNEIDAALNAIALDRSALSLPKLDEPVSVKGRMHAVDRAMFDPLNLLDMSADLQRLDSSMPVSDFISRVVNAYGMSVNRRIVIKNPLRKFINDKMPALLMLEEINKKLHETLELLLDETSLARDIIMVSGGNPTREELVEINAHLQNLISYDGKDPDRHRLIPKMYHEIGARMDITAQATAMLHLLSVIEQVQIDQVNSWESVIPLEIDTPQGKIRVGGKGDDIHSGDYLLLIDPGGNDIYKDVGREIIPGQVSIVIDLAGNDTITWEKSTGPGTGVMGIGIWVDYSGNDTYQGRNMGIGTALMGAGLLWDRGGDDRYSGGALTQGAGQYGIGILIDEKGNDIYDSGISSQGFGGNGGLGISIDLDGNDKYWCGGHYPDREKARIERHKSVHYLSMCQGYAFGLRGSVSGGIGLLLDSRGDDEYMADLFAQGGSYWFGLGMLIDLNGNDNYTAFEHAQGESLHLGAGFLGDWEGEDNYKCHEHCQGVGLDRAVGMLYDRAGNDSYYSHHDSQGTGLKAFGVGMLVDRSGNDRFTASMTSQGYAASPHGNFPDSQWPLGILLDMSGEDVFEQPYVSTPSKEGRILNRQGIAIDL